VGGGEKESCMQKLMLEECERMHEGLTCLCITKPLQTKTQPLQRSAALGAHASASHLQHISVNQEATVLSKHNEHALTWPSLHKASGMASAPSHGLVVGTVGPADGPAPSQHWSQLIPQFLPCSVSSTPRPALGIVCHGLKREAQHRQGNVTEGCQYPAVGVTAAKENLSWTWTASTSPVHIAANQMQRAFLIWHSTLSSKSLFRFPQPIPSL